MLLVYARFGRGLASRALCSWCFGLLCELLANKFNQQNIIQCLRSCDVSGVGTSTAIKPTTTTAPVANRAVATPAISAGRDPQQMSSACSLVIRTGTSTITVKALAMEVASNLIVGSFSSAPEEQDDWNLAVPLPFQVYIYSTCNTTANPSTNGLIPLGNFGTEIHNSEVFPIGDDVWRNHSVLFAFYDDLQIY